MRTFKDTAGRSWTVCVNCDALKRLRTDLKLNLIGDESEKALARLLGDPVALCDALYVLVKPDADKAGVSDVDFGRAMSGDALEAGATALLEELADFTPNRRDRALAARAVEAIRRASDKVRDVLDERFDKEAETLIQEAVEEAISGPKSGDSQDSSESTPAH
jgi:hypothetical protein